MSFVNTIALFIERHRLLSHDKLNLVALSGGADSVCLLLCLKELGYRIEAVHCNFHLRGDESNRDEQFVIELCKKNHIALHLTHFDTKTYASLHQVSIEMAARQLRYQYFEQLRNDMGAQDICVAHHLDDSVETLLLNLVRGTGIEGLTGIKWRNGHIVRPLLCVRRNDIEQWLKERGQDFVTDSTNLVADVQRNQLRLDIIPRLEQINPGVVNNIVRTAGWMSEANLVYQDAIRQTFTRIVKDNAIDLADLFFQPSAECILFEWLTPFGFTPSTIAVIYAKLMEQGSELENGLLWQSHTHQLVTHEQRIIVAPRPEERPTLPLPEPGNYHYDSLSSFSVKILNANMISCEANVATLDADKVSFPITVRPVRQGDRFQPFGMKGSKLVSDYLTDVKLSPIDKQRQLVMTDADGQIIWLVGRRTDNRFRITPDTKHTLLITQK
ncbi:MAG: tRNA lysidine(34) synthetase TilS [Prevotella sp.]|nr:tRNA lysidine(34) synthetase TilS [Prevotella sp.]